MVQLAGEAEQGGLIVGEHLLSFDSDSREVTSLIGSRCLDCGETYFPIVQGCTRCCSEDLEPTRLGAEGTLWSWTIQAFLPKEPYASGEDVETFKPYGVGYVEMACGVKVEARLTCANADVLSIGMPMKLGVVRYGESDQGESKYTYAFTPEEAV